MKTHVSVVERSFRVDLTILAWFLLVTVRQRVIWKLDSQCSTLNSNWNLTWFLSTRHLRFESKLWNNQVFKDPLLKSLMKVLGYVGFARTLWSFHIYRLIQHSCQGSCSTNPKVPDAFVCCHHQLLLSHFRFLWVIVHRFGIFPCLIQQQIGWTNHQIQNLFSDVWSHQSFRVSKECWDDLTSFLKFSSFNFEFQDSYQ